MKRLISLIVKTYYHILPNDPHLFIKKTTSRALQIQFEAFTNQNSTNQKCYLDQLWNLPTPLKILRSQHKDGYWSYRGKRTSSIDYDLLETYKVLRDLIEKYMFNKKHSAIELASNFLFSKQSDLGDFRGIYGTQFSPNYTGAILELLIKAGYAQRPEVEKGLQWLLNYRTDDGGWAIAMRTQEMKWDDYIQTDPIIELNRSKPFSHTITGMTMRAFAMHPKYNSNPLVHAIGELLISRIFKPDVYSDRRSKAYWTKFTWPFWFSDLMSVLDSLSRLNFDPSSSQIKKGFDWFSTNQNSDGGWTFQILRNKDKQTCFWLAFELCRILKRFYH
nr:hypothetical protein DSAG12_03134 [Candidatus Prometheoarchaeum syntrophicum]